MYIHIYTCVDRSKRNIATYTVINVNVKAICNISINISVDANVK